MIDPSEIRENYESFDDVKIELIAKQSARGLRNEIVPILIEEIRKRNLGNDLIEWIK